MSNSNNGAPKDMYGHPIYPLGETGFGVSVTFSSEGPDHEAKYPYFTIFHESDGFRQSLFSVHMTEFENRQLLCNVFQDRIAEHFVTGMYPIGMPRLHEVEP